MNNEQWNALEGFKKWLAESEVPSEKKESHPTNKLIGKSVESKVGVRKLIECIDSCEDGDLEEVAADFRENGGTILDADGSMLFIEVESGSFYLEKQYVRKAN